MLYGDNGMVWKGGQGCRRTVEVVEALTEKKKMTFERRLEKGKGGALQIF